MQIWMSNLLWITSLDSFAYRHPPRSAVSQLFLLHWTAASRSPGSCPTAVSQRSSGPCNFCPRCRSAQPAVQRKIVFNTVEVCNTGHIIMFKVILKLFAETFIPFFCRKAYTNNSTSHIWSSLHGSDMRSILFFKKGQLAGVTLDLSNTGHPSYFFKEIKN
jgi:hypothetical protein